MPTYDYECQKCGHSFELFQKMSDAPLRKCPQCNKLSLKRLIGTGAGIIFKGSGFYETDYRSDNYKKAAKKETGGTSAKATDKKETKTESKSTESAAKKKTA